MSITEKYLIHLDGIKIKISEWAKEAVLNNRGEIVNLVKFGQLSKGLNSHNQPLAWSGGSGFYALHTQGYAYRDKVQVPKTLGMPYNFSWTGETLDNMYLDFVDVQKSTYDIETVKAKEKHLEEIYGEIFKLTDEHNEYVNKKIIEPYIAKKIMEALINF